MASSPFRSLRERLRHPTLRVHLVVLVLLADHADGREMVSMVLQAVMGGESPA